MGLKKSRSSKRFEFLTLFTMVLGTVIGSGIYMKNNELLSQTHNPLIAIALWGVVGIICVLSVVVFIEISSATKYFGNGTIGNWSKIFINRKTASFFSLVYTIVYIPSVEAVFIGSFITYFFKALNMPLSGSEQLMIYLIAGIVILVSFTIANIYAPAFGKKVQIFGSIFKFVPLVIALVAGFFLISKSNAMWNGGVIGGETIGDWSTSNVAPLNFLGGFGAILFAFDGYVYVANSQKTAKHKEQVPKALLAGMIFVAIFYVLMAISLFVGSTDGSVVKLLEKLFSGGQANPSQGSKDAARIVSNIILMMICLINTNIYSSIGMIELISDYNVKIVYTKDRKMTVAKAAIIKLSLSITFYTILVVIGFVIPREGWSGINQSFEGLSDDKLQALYDVPMMFVGSLSSGSAVLVFIMINVLTFAAIRNRRTKKVKVQKVKFFYVCAWISGIFMTVFNFFGIFIFMTLDAPNWLKSDGFIFTVILVISLIVAVIAYFWQESRFKKDPFIDGFDGEIIEDITDDVKEIDYDAIVAQKLKTDEAVKTSSKQKE
ncbi:APC family permease [[Acholeplasma] multilocale]|uniref:APC family permease n=1 Tax=[Acholeplasma] multilocale TaxID=264638 RepID=UPI000687C3C8|nr:APC family permease [[Acholeplasma] multilocale]